MRSWRLDAYLLRRLAAPFALSVACLLIAFLLDRLLRLFQAAASAGGAFSSTLAMAADLVPHYLQQAIPAGFFAGIFIVIARLGDDNELDAMLAAGRSIAQTSRPFLLLGVVLAALCLYLSGFLQPQARYAYHLELYEMQHAGWNARVQDNTFVDAGRGFTLTANQVDSTGRKLYHVFLQQQGSGPERLTITAAHGRLVPTADGQQLMLELSHGRLLQEMSNGQDVVTDFAHGTVNENFTPNAPPFRARGDAENELSLPELWRQMHDPAPSIPHSTLAAAFNSRIARALLLPLLPLLGVPLGMAAKRGRRTPGVILAVVAVLGVDHALRFGQGLAQAGQAAAGLAIWTPYAVFLLICLWLFRQSLMRPGDNPLSRALTHIDGLIQQAGARLRPRR
ncbi:MAG TPA: LptF/LptG family permease [Nevskiaceae bacterium]|nr:LptF/LptG family permease [Nevskiaceae bacterium]